MSQRSNTIKAVGLYTYLSELLAPEGSLVKADNINIDERGVISPRRGLNDIGNSFGLVDDRLSQVLSYKNKIIRHYNSILQYEDSAGTFQDFDGTYDEIEDGFRIKSKEFNGNLYFTSNTGVKKISATSSADFTTATDFIVNAGAPKAVDLTGKILPTLGGFLPAQSIVGYKVLFGYKDANNVLILGSPSARLLLTNTSKDIFTQEIVEATFKAAIVDATTDFAGKYWLTFTDTQRYHVWYNTGADDEPQTAETIGSIGLEVLVDGADTESDIANKTANVLGALGVFESVEVVTSGSDYIVKIINKDQGDIDNPAAGSLTDASVFVVSTSLEGNVSEGIASNAELNFIIPNGVTTDYFYQVYRTPFITTVAGVNVEELDPGEDYNIVAEGSITGTPGDIVTVEDLQSETFRTSGVPLYNSRTQGEGVLQANERPPIAKDIELFQNFTFYSNTKSLHRLEFSMVSVDDFQSGITEFVVGNKDLTRIYTFTGTPEVTDIDCGTIANTLESTSSNDSYIIMYSSNDDRKYYMWFDKGAGDDPQVANAIGIRIDLTEATLSTAEDVAKQIETALLDISDFSAVRAVASLTITNTNNGQSTDADSGAGVPATDIGTGWTITPTNGTGADTGTNSVLLSGLTSVGQSIDETARSLVSIINQDTASPVSAFYLSGSDDLPGQILLENKSLEDIPFNIAVYDTSSTIGAEFSPELPLKDEGILTITPWVTDDTMTEIEATGHGLVNGQKVFVYAEDTSPSIVISGTFIISNVTANTFVIDFDSRSIVFDIPSSFFFLATQESDNEESPNRVYYSKLNQPEAVPIVNFIDIGSKDGAIERIVALRDNLFIFKTDGIYILSGFGAPFSVRLLDNTSSIIAPDSAVVLNNQIFCLTNEGVSTVSETSPTIISHNIENLILDVVNDRFDYRLKTFGVSYENDKSYIIWLPTKSTDTVATQAFRYNTYERTWTRWTVPATCGLVTPVEDRLHVGDGTRNYLLKERKDRDRTDYSDRNFTLLVPDIAVSGTEVRLSSTTEVDVGDVLVQEQYLTVALFNRLLRKLDIDKGLTDTDYETTLLAGAGDNIATKMSLLNTKIVADDASGTVTTHTYLNTDWVDLKDNYNLLIAELNDVFSDTLYKNYKTLTNTVTHEGLIVSMNRNKNLVYLKYAPLFLEGEIENYKGYEKVIQWNPLHYGDPSSLKQIREGTIMFDQNNFSNATVSYSSDLSPSFVAIPFEGNGPGYWNASPWGSNKLYWGGQGNDVPFRTVIPRNKQRARYINVKFDHINAREQWRILGISTVVRLVSSRAYR